MKLTPISCSFLFSSFSSLFCLRLPLKSRMFSPPPATSRGGHSRTIASGPDKSSQSSPTTTIQPSLDRFFSSSSYSNSNKPIPSSSNSPRNSQPFSTKRPKIQSQPQSPLSDRMRPSSLPQILGQDHLLGPTSILSSALSAGRLPSLLLWGPPGSGKTTIARAIATSLPSSPPLVKESGGGNAGVPLHLRNARTRLMKEFGYGEGYVYTPDHPEESKSQTYLPAALQGHKFLHWPPQPPEQKPH